MPNDGHKPGAGISLCFPGEHWLQGINLVCSTFYEGKGDGNFILETDMIRLEWNGNSRRMHENIVQMHQKWIKFFANCCKLSRKFHLNHSHSNKMLANPSTLSLHFFQPDSSKEAISRALDESLAKIDEADIRYWICIWLQLKSALLKLVKYTYKRTYLIYGITSQA